MKRLNASSDAPEARHGTLPNQFQAQRARPSYIPLARGRMGTPGCVREFVADSGACMHMVSKKELKSAELETMRMSRNPTTVMTANGEVQTREEATVYVTELDLFVTVMLLEETPRSYFALETQRGSWVFLTTGPAVKNHIEQCAIRSLSKSGPKCET